jgi:hypothetical protein
VRKKPEMSRQQQSFALRLRIAGFFLGLLYDLNDSSDTFLRKVGGTSPNYTIMTL